MSGKQIVNEVADLESIVDLCVLRRPEGQQLADLRGSVEFLDVLGAAPERANIQEVSWSQPAI